MQNPVHNAAVTTTPTATFRWAIFIVISLLALAIRLPQLGERPMHTDESVNAYITGQLLAGEKYQYDPQDRHGPVLYLLAEPIVKLCGAKNFAELTETQLRLTPLIIGSSLILLFGAAVEMFGFIACLVAALLFACAPLPVYYSRYFIHETLFVAATLGLILSGWHMVKNNSAGFAALTGLCAALMLACKETAVIHFFALACAGFIGWLIKPRAAMPSTKLVVTALGTFVAATILLFTWFGQNWSALTDMVHAVSRFAARAGGEGHEKPFSYYFHLLDPLVILSFAAIAGVYAAICDAVGGTRKATLPLVIYAVAIGVIYSAIPYKTPWLALNLWLPFTLLCGLGVASIVELIKNRSGRWGAGIAFAFLLATLGAQTKESSFDKPADEKNPYAYAHTGEDLLRLPARLEQLAKERNLTQPRIAVIATDAWPLPWYLRKFPNTGFWQPEQEVGAADFIITGSETPTNLTEQLKDFRPEFFGARPDVLLILWTPPAVTKKQPDQAAGQPSGAGALASRTPSAVTARQ